MGLLLDSHIFYWFLINSHRLAQGHRAEIADRTRPVFVSAVSAWEIAIKVKLGKWPEAAVLLPDLSSKVVAAGFEMLPISFAQAERAGSLELLHRDPFDRLLAAQALDLGIAIATVDPAMARFGCRVI
jgi:PIN domain nuclease of toxin-antitoxin system